MLGRTKRQGSVMKPVTDKARKQERMKSAMEKVKNRGRVMEVLMEKVRKQIRGMDLALMKMVKETKVVIRVVDTHYLKEFHKNSLCG